MARPAAGASLCLGLSLHYTISVLVSPSLLPLPFSLNLSFSRVLVYVPRSDIGFTTVQTALDHRYKHRQQQKKYKKQPEYYEKYISLGLFCL